MQFKSLRVWAVLLLAFGGIALAATRYRTDEITSEDGGAVAFPGGITMPTAAHYPVSTATFYSGSTYSATIAKVTNLDGITTPATLRYDRVGNYVHVWGRVGVNPSDTASLSTFSIVLPVEPDTFTGSGQATGTAGLPTTIKNGTCTSVSGSQKVRCTYESVSTSSDLVNVNFTYRVQ